MSQLARKKINKISLIVSRPRIYGPGNFQFFARYGPIAIATALYNAGFHVKLYDKSITPKLDLEAIADSSDLIGISSKTGALSDVKEILSQIRAYADLKGKNIPIVLGGEHASMAPEHSLNHLDIDYLIRGEGENSIIKLIDALNNNILRPDYIKGIGYKVNGVIYLNPDRDIIDNFEEIIPDLNLVDGLIPLLKSFRIKYCRGWWSLRHNVALVISYQGSRGCLYTCSFCSTTTDLHSRKYRIRSIESGIEYLKRHIKETGIKSVIFEDNLGVIDTPHFHDFFDRLKKEHLGINGSIPVRPEIYKSPKLLKKMRDAGIRKLNLGFESLNSKTLKEYNKDINLNWIEEAVEVIHKHGFSITAFFIVGADSDTVLDVYAVRDFVKKLGIDKWRITPLGQVPQKSGQLLGAHRIFPWGQLDQFGRELSDYLNGDYVCYYPKNIKPSVLQQTILKVNQELCSGRGIAYQFFSTFTRRGLMPTLERIMMKLCYNVINKTIVESGYIGLLKEIEKGMYKDTGNGSVQLLEEKVKERYDNFISQEKAKHLSMKKCA